MLDRPVVAEHKMGGIVKQDQSLPGAVLENRIEK
jgi:hypothetical protein